MPAAIRVKNEFVETNNLQKNRHYPITSRSDGGLECWSIGSFPFTPIIQHSKIAVLMGSKFELCDQ
jgi:hypothetical protein